MANDTQIAFPKANSSSNKLYELRIPLKPTSPPCLLAPGRVKSYGPSPASVLSTSLYPLRRALQRLTEQTSSTEALSSLVGVPQALPQALPAVEQLLAGSFRHFQKDMKRYLT